MLHQGREGTVALSAMVLLAREWKCFTSPVRPTFRVSNFAPPRASAWEHAGLGGLIPARIKLYRAPAQFRHKPDQRPTR